MNFLTKAISGRYPLLIEIGRANAYAEKVANLQISAGMKATDIGNMLEAIFGKPDCMTKAGPVAIIPVHGVIGKNLSDIEKLCGACDIGDIEEWLEDACNDNQITTIVLDIDSPGGTTTGVPEIADYIRKISKKTVAFTEDEACSAAYWIGSQCDEFIATTSSTVGSIGVYIALQDLSEAYKMEGVRMDIVKAGKYKAMGYPGTALTDDQRNLLQTEVDEVHADFIKAVLAVRSFADKDCMQGQSMSGKKGAADGLITGLVHGFDEFMANLNEQVAKDLEKKENHTNPGIGMVPKAKNKKDEPTDPDFEDDFYDKDTEEDPVCDDEDDKEDEEDPDNILPGKMKKKKKKTEKK
jgi:signal peptide peptidase SppA